MLTASKSDRDALAGPDRRDRPATGERGHRAWSPRSGSASTVGSAWQSSCTHGAGRCSPTTRMPRVTEVVRVDLERAGGCSVAHVEHRAARQVAVGRAAGNLCARRKAHQAIIAHVAASVDPCVTALRMIS